VHRYLCHLVRDRDLAEDLTSATFERALRDWRRYDPSRGRPSVWLVEIARRVALDHFRKEGRRRAREERWAAGEPQADPGPEGPGGFSEELREALGRLTDA
jgi:RNA polymerase sigma-70 factor (ECF subfamily)